MQSITPGKRIALSCFLILVVALIAAGQSALKQTFPENGTVRTAGESDSARNLMDQARMANDAWGSKTLEDQPPPPMPERLASARPDVQLKVDRHGNLLADHQILVLFEYHLAALEDEPLDQVLARLHYTLASQLDGPALGQARDLLQRYVGHKIALAELDASVQPPESGDMTAALQDRLASVEAIRRQYFDEDEYQAFFALEHAQNAVAVQSLALRQDTTLTDSERRQAEERLKAMLPPAIRALNERIKRDGELYAYTEELRQAGASPEAIYQERSEVLGPEAARELARLDQQREQWNQRLTAYQKERRAIRRSGLSEQDQAASIAALREQHFSGLERVRVEALELDYDNTTR
jgi:lipase chaperone LimK